MVAKDCVRDIAISDEARRLHFNTPVFDAHCDTLGKCASRGIDIGRFQPKGHIDLIKLEEGGVRYQVFAAFVHPSQSHRGFFDLAMRMNSALHIALEAYPSKLRLVTSRTDLKAETTNVQTGAIFGIEGAHPLEGEIKNLHKFYEKGLRLLTLTWNNPNPFADSSAVNPEAGGLTELGVKLIKEMNNLGIIPDLSHGSPGALRDVIKVSKKPVLVSHSCCKSICNIHRNLTNQQIKAVAASGGVIGVNFFPLFLDNDYLDAFNEKNEQRLAAFERINKKYGSESREAAAGKRRLMKRFFKFEGMPEVSYKKIVDHIAHIISIGNEDCVGLGSDFDGISMTPQGMENAACLPRLTEEMLQRRWDKKRIEKVLGLNMLRLFRQILP